VATGAIYPTRVEAQLDPQLSRWLWLVKWFLAIPHVIVLVFLWIAFSALRLLRLLPGAIDLTMMHRPRGGTMWPR
jgi:hypothetical protein